ncbi:MAG: Flp pilus assembly complex ATPase component TadA [Simkania sp.]|nr:Flp pilus assembly complex ATPase component TadA [Simkania sp.]
MSHSSLLQYADRFGLEILKDLSGFSLIREGRCPFAYSFVRKHRLIPLEEKDNGELWIAIADPLDLIAIEEARCLSGSKIKEFLASEDLIESAIERCFGGSKETPSHLIAHLAPEGKKTENRETSDGYDLLAGESQAPVIRLLNALIVEAIQQRASDIHFEPTEEGLQVRYRIDGVLQTRHAPSKEFQSQIVTRIKVLSRLDIAEQRLPQDGRIKLKVADRDIDFRVSSIPVAHGERIVLRILDKNQVLFGLSSIGMRAEILTHFCKLIRFTEGIILVTGPTGSGKTTTLYSALCDIQSPEINIMTIEDPVEYKLAGMAQIGVNHKIKLDFATGLKHILRQDPDVIMIGEIRDRETAEIAIQASLTGHLVVSTLHTNDAPSAVTRLVDMGVEPYLLSSSLIGVVAQRLVRKLCEECKITYEPSQEELKGLGIAATLLFRPCGCERCFGTGYQGRHGIYELMTVGHPIKQQILKSVDSSELKKVAMTAGLFPLKNEAAWLVQKGITSTAEALRVCRGLDEV